MDRCNTDLPIDIHDILPKLPVKSLLRFKTVSKSFNSLISSPTFICLHRHCSLSVADNRLLMLSGTGNALYSYNLNSLSRFPSHLSSTFRWNQGSFRIINSCNGVLLITSAIRFPLVLLNPSNRTYIHIPLPTEFSQYKYIGFGFDDHRDNYKIVLVCLVSSVSDESYTRVTSVYNVNSKSWKAVDQTSQLELINRGRGVLINHNLIHWVCSSYASRSRRIICFDVCTETWKDDVLLPSHYYNPTITTYFNRFGVLDGCLFSTFENEAVSSIHIWVMKEYGVQESWTKLLTVSHSLELYGTIVPVAYRGRGSTEVLLREYHGWKQVWYNLKDNTMKEARVRNFWENQFCICNENLVSLPGPKLFGAC